MTESPQTPRRGRPPRIGLEAILDAAAELGRERGPRGVTMRGIGQALGVDAAALYGHVESKEALLQALSVRAAERLSLPDVADRPWEDACLEACQSLREQLRRQPELGLLDGQWDSLAPFNARATGLLIGILERSPIPAADLVPASQALLYLITSVARIESGLAAAPSGNARLYNEQVREVLSPDLVPEWTRFAARSAAEAFDSIFTTGIRGLLAGLTPDDAR